MCADTKPSMDVVELEILVVFAYVTKGIIGSPGGLPSDDEHVTTFILGRGCNKTETYLQTLNQ